MDINELPNYDLSDNPTGCCPRFDPEHWDHQELHFQDKLFVRAKTRGLAHIPLNMGAIFRKTFKAIDNAGAQSDSSFIVLSQDKSAWAAEHLFTVSKDVPGMEMVRLTGDFITKVFEGPYKNLPKWCDELIASVKAEGKEPVNTYYFYTTCPKCAKTYGKNYVVGLVEVR
jgi:hypothetical protein